ncbi:MAG TPA: amino acid adenylation domain-containing protein, partial [Candidatus Kapabacteria bacterium]|nr:amino acid adenylation domain-containing protein [Candidatus Kapabacteria bacterium]
EMVIGILGILKAGGAYLPIDFEYPEDRINYMLKDSGAKLLVTTNDKEGEKVRRWEGEKVLLESMVYDSNHLKGRPRRGLHHSNQLAYVIYTSGTTGRPKGVMVEHRGLVNYIWWAAKKYVNKEKLNFPFYTSISFDLTVTSIFTPLITGNTIIIYGAKDIELSIDKIIDDNKAGSIKLTPSHLKLIREKKLDVNSSILKHLIVGGENFEVSLAHDIYDNFGGRIGIYNEYGPTEAVVGCMIYRFDPEKDNGESVLIGIPIDNIKIYVLDKYLKAVPIGVSGEIHIGADGLARGYLNREESTFEKFVENPFIPGQKMYKTGDLGRYLPDGNIEFLGRCDHQVKIRGYRIELGEIENELSRHNDIKETVVVAGENGKGNYYLCAYIVCRNKLELSPLREYLGKRLPDYMIPSYFVNIEKIPLTANGKINRKALPDPKKNSLEDNIECMPPQNAVEKILAEIWTKVLGRENVGINQNFFAIGGDSIKSIQIISRMSSAGYKLEMKDIFQYPLISDLAPRIKKMKRFPDQSTVAGTIPLTPIQEKFFNESHIEPYHYNQSVMLYSKDGFKKEAIKEVFSRIQEHHDALRMTYQMNNENGEIIQIAHGLDYPISLQEYDLR